MNQPTKSYYRVMLGRQSAYAAECLADGFIGANYEIHQDLSGRLPDEWRQFNSTFLPVSGRPPRQKQDRSWPRMRGALDGGQGHPYRRCGALPGRYGHYRVGEVQGDYCYAPARCYPTVAL